jgi:hypothetical protein
MTDLSCTLTTHCAQAQAQAQAKFDALPEVQKEMWAQRAAEEDAANPSGRKLQAADSIPDFNDVAAWEAHYFTVSWKEGCGDMRLEGVEG